MTEYQAAYFRRRSLCRVSNLLTDHFAPTQLLTLRYTPGPPLPAAVTDRQYQTLMGQARQLAGGPFRYIKLTEHGTDPSAPPIVHRLFLDLPAGTCQQIACRWFMGEATIEPLTPQQLAAFSAELAAWPIGRMKSGRRIWSTSRGLSRQA